MSKESLKIGEASKPRYEFRTFGQHFDDVHYKMSRLSVPVPQKVWERQSEEIYIVSRTNDQNNTKIRDGKMDIKTLVDTVDGLEQWNPLMKGEFPMEKSLMEKEVLPAFQVDISWDGGENISLEAFMDLVRQHPQLQAVRVRKQRFGYMVHDTICEFAHVWINGARVSTVNSESTEIEDIKKTLVDVGLEGVENINYLQAIKRVIGMINKPLANE
ncbi:hypothetical protein QLX67_09670 [Balneolaceae bacterium ANBcel3]|nr:hypothetical protein [Balneolaceae bacterium ANBcel3]